MFPYCDINCCLLILLTKAIYIQVSTIISRGNRTNVSSLRYFCQTLANNFLNALPEFLVRKKYDLKHFSAGNILEPRNFVSYLFLFPSYY